MRLHLLILVWIACLVQPKVQGAKTSCPNSPLDIIFALDTSDGVSATAVETGKNLLKKLIESIFDQNNRFGLLTFGDHVFLQFELNTYTSVTDIMMAIDYMWLTTGKGQLDKAIEYGIENGFSKSKGDRQNASNVMIVTALSGSMNTTQTRRISDKLQDNMVDLILLDNNSKTQVQTIENIDVLPIPTTATMVEVTRKITDIMCKEKGVLKPWSSWSQCGKTCGKGVRRRYKECAKRRETDTCAGDKLETEQCMVQQCSDPVNGGWTYWQEWSTCSKTCGSGIQTRQRLCKAPAPANGGKPCQGQLLQSKSCSDWECPNCSYVCEPGSTLSVKCDMCLCENTTLYGIITSELNVPLEGVDVFLKSKPYEKLCSTDENGNFVSKNLCFTNTTLVFKKKGFLDLLTDITYSQSHGNVSAKMKKIVPPMILQQPENKVRLVGQNISLCCVATGRPMPEEVQWFKDGEELNQTADIIRLTNLKQTDAGTYSCSVETDAGITKSQEAVVEVLATATESCSRPLFNTRKLPNNCTVLQNGVSSSIVDVGKCSRERCIGNTFKDNDTCADPLQNFCCDVENSEDIEVSCAGFSYTLRRITSCVCKECVISSVVEGTAYGKFENGTRVPFAFGYLYVNGKRAAVANEMGYFQFEVQRQDKQVIIYFSDETFDKFVPTTKIIQLQRDSSTYATIVLPINPPPVHFDSQQGVSVDLGGSDTLSPAGGLTIPDNALVTEDGKPFTGAAKASVHFMDPRKLTDLEASNGNFVYNTEDGTTAPLETFGMFRAAFQDANGRPLKAKKKLTFNLDASLFNVSLNDDGTPDLALWSYDVNNGIWVETVKMRFSDNGPSDGRRKLLDRVLVGDFDIAEIDHIDMTVETPVYQRVIIGYTNCDHSVPIYASRIVGRDVKVKRNACYMSVSVYMDLTYKSTAGAGTNIVVATKEMNGNKFLGMDSKTTDMNGHACLSVFCDAQVFVYAESRYDGSRLIASRTHDLPIWYENFKNTKNDTEVEIRSYNIEEVMENGKTRYSPLVAYENLSKCNSNPDEIYRFQFAYYAMPSTLSVTQSVDDSNNKLSWYPVPKNKPFAKACFIKIAVTTDEDDTSLIATSYQNTIQSSNKYGTYEVSPSFDVNGSNRSLKAACIEYRCAGRYSENGKVQYDSKTVVDINLISQKTCKLTILTKAKGISIPYNRAGLIFNADPNMNYGPEFGIYIGNGNADKIQSFCSSGTDSGAVEKFMKPTKNVAAEFSCV